MTELQFLSNEAGENEGLGHAGISTFLDRPYASAAKEAGQNSMDAMVLSPVIMEFKLHKVARHEVPFIGRLEATIDQCLKRVEKRYDKKEEDFFRHAKGIVEQDHIEILEIADYNTKGLEGGDRDGSPFSALLKGSGVSEKQDDSGGSHGIGKNASFAISDLRTVVYATVYEDENNQKRYLGQGKVVLASHTDVEGKERKATGWWGLPGFKAIDDKSLVPRWMHREESGTSVFAVGFRVEKDWEYRVVASLLKTFFVAVHREQMEFRVGSKIHIKKETLEKFFDCDEVKDAARAMHLDEDMEFSKALYECEKSPHSDIRHIKETDASGKEGVFEVKILKAQGMPRRVGFIRNGMLITDNLSNFGQKFSRFPMCADFIALVTPADKNTSVLLKSLENPAHDQFSAERISLESSRASAKQIMEKAGKAIREKINEVTKSSPKDVESIDELAEYFADSDTLKEGDDGDESLNRYKYKSVSKRPARPPTPGKDLGNRGGPEGEKNDSSGANGGKGPGQGKGLAGGNKVIHLAESRNLLLERGRQLWFTPNRSTRAHLQVFATGVADAVALSIRNSNRGFIKNGILELDLKEGERESLIVSFDETYTGPIQVIAYTEVGNED